MRHVVALPRTLRTTEARLVAWHCSSGQELTKGSRIARVETDFMILDIASPIAGRVAMLCGAHGESVLGREFVRIEGADGAATVEVVLEELGHDHDHPSAIEASIVEWKDGDHITHELPDGSDLILRVRKDGKSREWVYRYPEEDPSSRTH